MEEIWKPVEGWEGKYEVSNLGRVKSLPFDRISSKGKINHFPERIMKITVSPRGYCTVSLSKGRAGVNTRLVHRLVGKAFVPNPDPEHFTMINHKDENKSNNVADNLEWCDAKYNVNYGTANQRRSYSCTIHLKNG